MKSVQSDKLLRNPAFPNLRHRLATKIPPQTISRQTATMTGNQKTPKEIALIDCWTAGLEDRLTSDLRPLTDRQATPSAPPPASPTPSAGRPRGSSPPTARRVRGGAVDLRGVLPGVRAAAVPPDRAVGVDDVLAPGEPGVGRRPAQHEGAAAVHVDLGLVVHPSAHHRPDHLADDVLTQLLVVDFGVVLRGDDDGLRALRHAEGVLDGDL